MRRRATWGVRRACGAARNLRGAFHDGRGQLADSLPVDGQGGGRSSVGLAATTATLGLDRRTALTQNTQGR